MENKSYKQNQENEQNFYNKKVLYIDECENLENEISHLIKELRQDYEIIKTDSVKEGYNIFQDEKNDLDIIISKTKFNKYQDLEIYKEMRTEKPNLKYIITENQTYSPSKKNLNYSLKKRSFLNRKVF